MALSEIRLEDKIVEVMREIRSEENDPDMSMRSFAKKLAKAIVEEIKETTIVATAPNGPVTIQSIS
ncbi:hypothetical protein CMT52_07875 [Elizabethkingia anophelis]|nr:hypothetical protein [Elizabethkingia anophelis]